MEIPGRKCGRNCVRFCLPILQRQGFESRHDAPGARAQRSHRSRRHRWRRVAACVGGCPDTDAADDWRRELSRLGQRGREAHHVGSARRVGRASSRARAGRIPRADRALAARIQADGSLDSAGAGHERARVGPALDRGRAGDRRVHHAGADAVGRRHALHTLAHAAVAGRRLAWALDLRRRVPGAGVPFGGHGGAVTRQPATPPTDSSGRRLPTSAAGAA